MRILLQTPWPPGWESNTRMTPLSIWIWAMLNVQMDDLAKKYLSYAFSAPHHYSIKGEPWQIWVAGKKLTGKISNPIHLLVHDQEGHFYWT
jgi:hypothetical protein